MSDMKVKDLAGTVGITAEKLVEQLNEAGISVSKADDLITEAQKQTLLQFLQQRHGRSEDSDASPKKITLKRKSVSEIKLGGSARAGGKSVSVEVRKKRTFVKRPTEAEATPSVDVEKQQQAQAHAEELARQEQLRQQEVLRKQQEQITRQQEIEAAEAAEVAAAVEAEKQAAEEARLAAEEEQKAIAEEAKQKAPKKSDKPANTDKKPVETGLTASQLQQRQQPQQLQLLQFLVGG
jgi:translation initiation factor IF-2